MNEHSQEPDDLRARLARLDPQAGQPVAPITPERKERAMSSTAPTPTGPTSTEHAPRSRRPLLVAAAAGLLAVGVGGTLVALSQDDEGRAPTTLALGAEPVSPTATCLAVSAESLATADVALAGTVTSVEGTGAVLDVTRWYRGGDADRVSVTQEGGPDVAALTGLGFEVGTTYLLAASGSTVGACSGSGPDSPALRALFDEAFGG